MTALRDVGEVPSTAAYLRESWRYRDFTTSLARADARAHHVDTALGSLWQILNPTLLVGVYYLIFGVLFDVTRGLDNYLGFLVIGVFMFTFTRKSMSSGARAILNNRSLLQSIRFPRVVLPIATVLAELLIFLPSIIVIVAVVIATGEPFALTWFLLVPLVLVQLVFNAGLALAASRATVRFRDLDELLPFLLRLWFYMSGVLYPISRVEDKLGDEWRVLFEANPANVYLTIGRDALLEGTTSGWRWLVGIVWAVGIVIVALWFFRRHELEYGGV
ncbi:MAG: ABC transporter permease [Acidimicrobiales bacterium]|nr:ABC transporter permease [Acidimicrobiales bacterium]